VSGGRASKKRKTATGDIPTGDIPVPPPPVAGPPVNSTAVRLIKPRKAWSPLKDRYGFITNQLGKEEAEENDKNTSHWVQPKEKDWLTNVGYPLYAAISPKQNAGLPIALFLLCHFWQRKLGFELPTSEFTAAQWLKDGEFAKQPGCLELLQLWIGVSNLFPYCSTVLTCLQRVLRWCKRFAGTLGNGGHKPYGLLRAVKNAMALIRSSCAATVPQVYYSDHFVEVKADCWPLFKAQFPAEAADMGRSSTAQFLNFCVAHCDALINADTPPPRYTPTQWRDRLEDVYTRVQEQLAANNAIPYPPNPEING
jgi:hypothetical protein